MKLFTKTWFWIALVTSCIACFYVVRLFEPKQLIYLGNEESRDYRKDYIRDLNHDGESELIVLQPNLLGQSSYFISTGYQSVRRQFDWDGEPPVNDVLNFQDYDNNGIQEVYSFAVRSDSVFLNILEYGETSQIIKEDWFVVKISEFNDRNDVSVSSLSESFDLNGDGFKEVLIGISATFGAYPRSLFGFDIKNQRILRSPPSSTLTDISGVVSLKDGSVSIVSGHYAPGNCVDVGPCDALSDEFTWLYMLDSQLNYRFEPRQVGGFHNSLAYINSFQADQQTFFNYNNIGVKNDTVLNTLITFDQHGEEVNRKTLITPAQDKILKYLKTEHEVVLITRSGRFYQVDNDLSIRTLHDAHITSERIEVLDLEGDGTREIVFTSGSNQSVTIVNSDMTAHQTFQVPVAGLANSIQVYDSKDGRELLLAFDNFLHRFNYMDNPIYPFRYLAAILTFLIVLWLCYFIDRYQRLSKGYRDYELLTWKLKALKNQIDPHFLFNTLNSLNAAVNKGHQKIALEYVNGLSQLLRSTLEASDDLVVSLDDELGFVKAYLNLESKRFKDKYKFLVNISLDIPGSLLVPKLIILNQVENAIKHGLMDVKQGGQLTVYISINDGWLHIIVSDNGIGRKASFKKSNFGLGKGTGLTSESIALYKREYKHEIRYEVIDLIDSEGEPCGTRTDIRIKI